MAETLDRSVLESKAVTELKQIAKSLDLKVTGLKKAEIIEKIAGSGNGQASPKAPSAPKQRNEPQAATENPGQSGERKREQAPPLSAGEKSQSGAGEKSQSSANEQGHSGARDQSQGRGGSDNGGRGQRAGNDNRESGVRDDGASDDRDSGSEGGGNRGDRNRGRGPKGRDNRNRPREKAEPQGGGRRRRRRRGGGGGGQPYMREESWEELEAEDDPNAEVRTGILDLLPEGYGFLRTSGYLAGDKDVYVSASQVRRFRLRKGDELTGSVRSPKDSEKYQALLKIHKINGSEPDRAQSRPRFGDLTPLYPQDRLMLEHPEDPRAVTARIIDLVAPIGKGQRGMIVSPPKAGKTTVLQQIANAVRKNNPEVHLIVLLVDERPEEVTDMQRSVEGAEVIYSTFDRPSDDHIQVTELTLERCKRLVEMGRDVMVVLDGITRLSRAYNLATPASGRILSGGVDSTALYPPKRFFGAARNIEHGGSLTVLATALVDTGSRMDEVIFEEFKGTGNWELKLDRKMSEKRIFPAIDIQASGTRKEELLFEPEELQIVWRLRRVLHGLEGGGALELLIDKMKSTASNAQFLREIAKVPVKGD
ncbi:MAG: transcription termination factor Rho [Actinomycetota bacterium]